MALLLLASLTPTNIEVHITDEEIEPVNFDNEADLVGITANTLQARRAYEIADIFREKGVPVVLGGAHPTLLPDEAMMHADSVVIGEAEEIWPKLLSDFKERKLKKVYRCLQFSNLENLPPLRRDLLNPKNYLFTNSVQATRGCPFDCEFCSVSKIFGRSYRCRPVEQVVDEVKSLTKGKHGLGKYVFFIDDNIGAKPDYAKELFEKLIPLKIRWWSQACITIAEDKELLKLMAKSGCFMLLIGLESTSQENLKVINKPPLQQTEKYPELIERIHKAGIGIWGSFIFGLDGDTKETFKEITKFAKKSNLELVSFIPYTPFPGTKLYERLKKEGRLLKDKWWLEDHNGYTLGVMQPKQMSNEELALGNIQAYEDFYSIKSILKRLVHSLRRTRRGFIFNLGANLGMRKALSEMRSIYKERKFL
jgi:radical SAM superfamily enzyme YgiQ (UPF0313 family)